MALGDLFVAASFPVIKVLLVTALGSFLALDRINILGEDARKHLNNIVFYVFNPALVSSNLAESITFESMLELWFMPLNILVTFIIGSLLGWVVIQVTRAPPHLRGLVVGCCAAGNLGNMLLIIIPAVCKEQGSPFGDPDACYSYGMAYASLSMAIGAIYLWSYVYNIVRISSNMSQKEVEVCDSSVVKSSRESSSNGDCTEPLLNSNDKVVPEEHPDQFALPCTGFEGESQVPITGKIKHHFKTLMNHLNLKRLFAPSTTGAIAGFVVGLVPQIRKSMIGDSAPLHVIQDTAILIGHMFFVCLLIALDGTRDGAIPALTLILGANLLKGLRRSGIQKSLIAGIVIVRYVALPLVGIAVVKGALRFGFVPNNPLYEFVLLLQFALPPAMNIGTITQLFGAGESECSVIMLWMYALASLSLTLWSTFFMWLVA